MRRAAVATLALIALAGCGNPGGGHSYSGTVQAESAAVGSTIGGRVTGVFAEDGQSVKGGAVLVRFDDRQLRAEYDAALAEARQAQAQLADLAAGPRSSDIDKAAAAARQAEAAYRSAQLAMPQRDAAAVEAVRGARADFAAARATAYKANRDAQRYRTLFEEGAISAQAADAAASDARSATGAAVAAAARLRSAIAAEASARSGSIAQDVASAGDAAAAADANLAQVRAGARPDQIVQARAAVASATANAAQALARLSEAAVTSPASGIVNGLDLHAGDLVAAGATVATIDEFADPWVRIYVAQSDLGRFIVGASVGVRSDAVSGTTFSGRVEAIDTAAQFTPRDVETASDRADLSFGVKVRIHDPGHELRPGTTVEVSAP